MIIVLTILAVARVTRLVTTDVLTETPRVWLTLRLESWPRIQYLIHCDWCASVYTGAAGAVAYAAWGETLWFMAVVLALSASYATGFLASITERGD